MNEDLREQLCAELAELSLHRQEEWIERRDQTKAVRAVFAHRRRIGKQHAHAEKLARLVSGAPDPPSSMPLLNHPGELHRPDQADRAVLPRPIGCEPSGGN